MTVSRIISLVLSIGLHGGGAALVITWGLGRFEVPSLAVNSTATVPSALDVSDRSSEIAGPSDNPYKDPETPPAGSVDPKRGF